MNDNSFWACYATFKGMMGLHYALFPRVKHLSNTAQQNMGMYRKPPYFAEQPKSFPITTGCLL